MAYRNLMAELARNGLNRYDLVKKLKENGLTISYQKLSRQLRGECDIPYGQALLMSNILGCDVKYIMDKEV